ncbi:MAG: hypothetical protein AABY33_00220 [Pseudomonadota bacterium]
MTDWQMYLLPFVIGGALGMLYNISDKMDKIYKILLERHKND